MFFMKCSVGQIDNIYVRRVPRVGPRLVPRRGARGGIGRDSPTRSNVNSASIPIAARPTRVEQKINVYERVCGGTHPGTVGW